MNKRLKINRKIIYLILTISFLISPLYPYGNNFKVDATGLGGWSYNTQLLIDNTQNASTLTNYQVSVTVNTSSLVAKGYMRSDCGDIRFLDSDNTTQITNYWVEPTTCNTTTTKVWVKIPSLTASTLYPIYMYYGNAGATTLSSTTNTFIDDISGVKGAWNLDEGSGTVASDKSGNSNTGTWQGTTPYYSQGKFTLGGNFNGSNNYVNVSSPSNLNLTNFTISSWVKFSQINANQYIMEKGVVSGSDVNFYFWYNYSRAGIGEASAPALVFGFSRGFNLWQDHSYAFVPTVGNWYHLAVTYNGTIWTLYINGVSVVTRSETNTPDTSGTQVLNIGSYRNGDANDFLGNMNQVRVFNTVLTSTQVGEENSNYGYTTTNYASHELIRKYSSPDPVMYIFPSAPTSPGSASDTPYKLAGNPDGTSVTGVSHYIQFVSKNAVASGKTFTVYMQCNATAAAGFNTVTAPAMIVEDGANIIYNGTGTVTACASGNVSTFSGSSFIPIVTAGTTNAAILQNDVITITGISATNPNTVATSAAPFIIDIQDNSSTSDEQFLAIPISSTNYFQVSAIIPPLITLGLSTTSLNFGVGVIGLNTESGNQVTLTTSTNAVGGESVFIYDSGATSDSNGSVGGLWSAASVHKIPCVSNTGAGTAAGGSTEQVGVNAGTYSTSGVGGFTVQAPFNSGTVTTIGGYLKNATTLFALSTGPVGGSATLTWVINSTVLTPASSYTDSVTFSAVGSF